MLPGDTQVGIGADRWADEKRLNWCVGGPGRGVLSLSRTPLTDDSEAGAIVTHPVAPELLFSNVKLEPPSKAKGELRRR